MTSTTTQTAIGPDLTATVSSDQDGSSRPPVASAVVSMARRASISSRAPSATMPPRNPSPAQSVMSFGPARSANGNYAPFRQVAYDQLIMPGSPRVAPTLVDPSENRRLYPQAASEGRARSVTNPRAASLVGFPMGRPAAQAPVTSAAVDVVDCCKALQVPPGAYIKLCVKANTVYIYNMSQESSGGTRSSQGVNFADRGNQQKSTSQPVPPAHERSPRPYAMALSPRFHEADFAPETLSDILNSHGGAATGVAYDERSLYPPSPQVYPIHDNIAKHMNISIQHPTPPAAVPPEFREPGQLAASSRPDGVTPTRVVSNKVAESAGKAAKQTFALEPAVCEKGADCTCNGSDSINLLKDAATYLFKTFNAFRQDVYVLHTQTLAAIEDLSNDSIITGADTLPTTVLQTLESEASQLVQDWQNAEALCTQYICDCILADVNGPDGTHASDVIAKSTPADAHLLDKPDSGAVEAVVDIVAERAAAVRPEEVLAEHDSQCGKNFEEIKSVLIALTGRSERLKKQWINLLDLCTTLQQSTRV